MKEMTYRVHCKDCKQDFTILVKIEARYDGFEFRCCPACGSILSWTKRIK